ncbi:MAG: AarF/ABC1/UbiB kinase family protein [Gaiellales bacterium]|nr:MAG: AarF/ABC1/UbiB kinase family protein [Gaiellales bacterium]
MPIARSVRNIDRIRQISEVAVRHGFGYYFERHDLRNLLPRAKKRRQERRPGSRGEHIRRVLEELGPTFIKFGQVMSTRPDIVPPDIIVELRKLQDDVPPFPVELAYESIESQLGLSVERLFLEFEDEPIAAASIGQVHRAVLPGGDRVIVKVQRPEAESMIRADISVLYQLAQLLRDHTRQELFFDPESVVDQLARTVQNELDYRVEARNAERFGLNFHNDPDVKIPRVYWQYTTSRVLTMEYLDGTQIVDVDTDAMTMPERKALAQRIADAWLKQVFQYGFFHGDPHPANIMLLDGGAIGLVDFGITGRLSENDRQNVISLFLDVIDERVERIPKRLEALGVEFPREKERDFVIEVRDLFTKYYGASLGEIDAVGVMRDVFTTIFRLQLKLPSQYLLLDKTIATLEGIGTQLCPDFNVFETARPYARAFMRQRFSPASVYERGSSEVMNYLNAFRDYPFQLHDTLEQVRKGEVRINFVHRNLEDVMRRMTVLTNRVVMAVVLSSLILGSSIIGLFAEGGPRLMGISVFALFGFLASGFFGLWLIGGIMRSGRR